MDDSIDLNPFRRRLRKHGESADARVLEVDISKNQSPGAYLTHKFVVEVQPSGAPPFQAKVKDAFNVFWAPKRGDLLRVKFNPKSHKVAFDLEGDPRYDSSMQKQPGQWTPGEAPPPSIFGTSSTGAVESPPAAPRGTSSGIPVAGATVFQGMPDGDAIAAAIAAAQQAAASAAAAAGVNPTGAAPGSAPDTTGSSRTVERLQQLAQLRDAEVITAEDFETQKLRILESL